MNFFTNNNDFGQNAMMRFAERYYSSPVSESSDPVSSYAKAMARSQLELWALANRRARATLTLPSQLAASRSPQTMLGVYADFWKAAFMECADTTHRISELFAPSGQQIASGAIESERSTVTKAAKSLKVAKPVRLNGAQVPGGEEYRRAS